MNKILGIAMGLVVTSLVTVGTLFLIRHFRPLANAAGVRPATGWNPLDQEAAA